MKVTEQAKLRVGMIVSGGERRTEIYYNSPVAFKFMVIVYFPFLWLLPRLFSNLRGRIIRFARMISRAEDVAGNSRLNVPIIHCSS